MREDWTQLRFDEAVEIFDSLRQPISQKERAQRNEGKMPSELFPYYGATGQAGWIDSYILEGEYVLLGEDGAPFFDLSRDVAYTIKGKSWVNNHAHILRSRFDNAFLCHYLNQFDFRGFVSGTTRLKLTQGALKKMTFPMPPIPEQRAIVAKLEGLFSELDNGVRELKSAQEKLKVYRQSVLKKAFEGELTKDWRAKQTDLPTGEELLDQIQEERERDYAKQLEEWNSAVKTWESSGKPGKKPYRHGNHDWIASDYSGLLTVPAKEHWAFTNSGNVFSYVTSGSRGWAKYYAESGGIFIRITNLNWDSLDLDLRPDKVIYVDVPKGGEGVRTRVQSGDFLFSITGDLGMFAIAPELEEAYVNQHVSLARPLHFLNKEFLGYWMISKSGGVKHLNDKSKGATKAGLGLDDIKGFPIPLCSREEQDEVVLQIKHRLKECDRIEEGICDNMKRAEILKKSLLKRAFEGQLLTEEEIEQCQLESEWSPTPELLR